MRISPGVRSWYRKRLVPVKLNTSSSTIASEIFRAQIQATTAALAGRKFYDPARSFLPHRPVETSSRGILPITPADRPTRACKEI